MENGKWKMENGNTHKAKTYKPRMNIYFCCSSKQNIYGTASKI